MVQEVQGALSEKVPRTIAGDVVFEIVVIVHVLVVLMVKICLDGDSGLNSTIKKYKKKDTTLIWHSAGHAFNKNLNI